MYHLGFLVPRPSETGIVLNQMAARAGIKKHGRSAEEALMKEFAQLEDLNVYEAVDPKTLTKRQKPSTC